MADEFRAWVESWRGNLSVREVQRMLDVGRAPLTQALDASITGRRPWSRAHNGARSRWLANRERWLTMTLEELEAERDERDEREARAKAADAADALSAEAEVHDDDAPYATANDEGLQAISGVSDENIDAGSTPLAGRPRKVEQGGEPDEEASQPDAELSDDATPSIIPSDAPDATALTPVAPADVPVGSDDASAATDGAPAVQEAPAQSSSTPLSDAPAADASAADASAADASAGVSPDAPAGDAPADAPAAADAPVVTPVAPVPDADAQPDASVGDAAAWFFICGPRGSGAEAVRSETRPRSGEFVVNIRVHGRSVPANGVRHTRQGATNLCG